MKSSYAGLQKRVQAFAYDYLLIFLYTVLLTLLGFGLHAMAPEQFTSIFSSPYTGQLVGFLMLTTPAILYFALLESSIHQGSWGKQKTALSVVNMQNQPISRLQALYRNVLKFLPWEIAHFCIWQMPFIPGEGSPFITTCYFLVWILIGANLICLWVSPKNQMLYDWIAGTQVVRKY
jgi:uncharacterized RDD family membrane protein YckC